MLSRRVCVCVCDLQRLHLVVDSMRGVGAGTGTRSGVCVGGDRGRVPLGFSV